MGPPGHGPDQTHPVVREELQALVDLKVWQRLEVGPQLSEPGVCYLWKHSSLSLPLLQVPPPRLEPNTVREDLNTFPRNKSPWACMYVGGLYKGERAEPRG